MVCPALVERCVCGCTKYDHRLVVMSVPMLRSPGVPPPKWPALDAFKTSTYERVECVCGCGEFLRDTG